MRSDFMEILRHPLVSLLVHVYVGDSETLDQDDRVDADYPTKTRR